MENARKKDIVFQRLQTPIHFYEAYGELLYDLDINSFEDLRKKYRGKPREMAKVWYVLNHFNALGLLIKEGLATAEQIFQQYLPLSVILIYQKYEGEIINSRYRHGPTMEVHNPDAYKGFEMLYEEAWRLYPKTPTGPWSMEDLLRDAREMDEFLRAKKGSKGERVST